MPGTGRPTSPWWAHFQAVEGCIQISRFLVIYLECAGDFRVVRCLHCDQLVRRGKVGCTPKQTSNTGMSTHMRTKHLGQAAEVLLWIMMFHKQSCASSGSKTGWCCQGGEEDWSRSERWDGARLWVFLLYIYFKDKSIELLYIYFRDMSIELLYIYFKDMSTEQEMINIQAFVIHEISA